MIKAHDIYKTSQKIRNVYIHLPFCKKKCHFCAFPIHAIGSSGNHSQILFASYLNTLKNQISMAELSNLSSLYFGGGTPSLYQPEEIFRLIEFVRSKGAKQIEQITFEMNVEQIGNLKNYQAAGVNRFSIGVQGFNNKILKQCNREWKGIQSQNNNESMIDQIKENLSKYRPKNLSIDFIMDLSPSNDDLTQIKEFISKIKPQHLTMYLLQLNEGSYLHRNPQLQQYFLQKGQTKPNIINNYLAIGDWLKDILGYRWYEVSNFAKEDRFMSKHNSVYWEGVTPFHAFGMGSSSLINGRRITRPKTLQKYNQYMKHVNDQQLDVSSLLEVDDQRNLPSQLQSIILSSIRTDKGIKFSQINDIFEQHLLNQGQFKEYCCILKDQCQRLNLQRPGLIKIDEEGIKLLSGKSFLVADAVGYMLLQTSENFYRNIRMSQKIY